MQPQTDVAGLKKTVDDFSSASIEAMTTNNTEKVIMYYTDDATQLPNNGPAVKGRENIKAEMEKMMSMGMKMKDVSFTSVEVNAAGDFGYEIGNYSMTMEMAPMGEMKDDGKYVTLFKKQQDGSWKVYAEIWNTNTPIPAMEPPKEMKKKK
jgi:uncharacterized protein (TIGR02246 family)